MDGENKNIDMLMKYTIQCTKEKISMNPVRWMNFESILSQGRHTQKAAVLYNLKCEKQAIQNRVLNNLTQML